MDLSAETLNSLEGILVPTCEEVKNDESDLITDKMLEQEKMLEHKILAEEEEIENKMLQEAKREKEQCFKRLQHLLDRSSVYARYLAEKLEHQEQQPIKKKAKQKQQSEKPIQMQDDQNQPRSSKRTASSVNDAKPVNTIVPNNKRKKKYVTESSVENSRSKKHKGHNTLNIKDYFTKEDLSKKANEGKEVSQKYVGICTDEEVSNLQPKLFSGGVMRPYQIDGYEWLKVLYENGVNGILADEMGLGKTIQCIAFISHLVEMNVPGPFFVCAPLSTLSNWVSEFNRFAPGIPTLLFHGDKEERKSLAKKIRKKVEAFGKLVYPVIVTSYQIAIIEQPKLANIEWKYLIIDEAHRIKNYECRLFRELKQYNALNRLLLTGTPLQNNLAELWALLNFILPEIFDDLKVFEAWFDIKELTKSEAAREIAIQEKEKSIISYIHQILTPFLLRRTKTDITLLLPPKKEITVYAPLSSLQQEYYNRIINKTIEAISGNEKENDIIWTKRNTKKINYKDEENKYFTNDDFEFQFEEASESLPKKYKSSQLNITMRSTMMMLRKACSHPYLISHPLDSDTGDYLLKDDFVECCGKLLVLDAMLPELRSRGHRILLFSQFVMMLDLLAEFCELRDFKYLRYDGTMNISDRDNNIKCFNEDKSHFLFLISTRAGGLGINLASADTVIFYDSDWNPQCDLQAQDRCHRIGQTKPVVVYRLVTKNTIDQKMVERADAKRKLEKMIIQKGRFTTNDTLTKSQTAITPEELLELLHSCDIKDFVETKDSVFLPGELEALLDRSDMIDTENEHKWT